MRHLVEKLVKAFHFLANDLKNVFFALMHKELRS